MSIKVMTSVWDGFPASGSELLAMLALADWCDDNGGSLYPSIKAIAKKIRVSESQARRIVRGFESDGFISVIGNKNGGAPGATRHYRLNVAKLRALAAEKERETGSMDATPSVDATPGTDATPSMDARDGLHGCARRVAPMRETAGMDASQTTIEPSEKRDISTSCGATEAAPQSGQLIPAEPVATATRRTKATLTPEMQEACRSTWDSYSGGYADRYGVNPVFNGKVAGQVVNFVKRVGMKDAPDIARWFPGHSAAFYVSRGHTVDTLLRDAEKLRTEWMTGRVMTSTKAKQSDRSGATMSALQEVLAERGEATGGAQ